MPQGHVPRGVAVVGFGGSGSCACGEHEMAQAWCWEAFLLRDLDISSPLQYW